MTQKDFEVLARAFAECEGLIEDVSDKDGIGASTLRIVVDSVCGHIKQANPRFDKGRFTVAALPRQNERQKQAILKTLGMADEMSETERLEGQWDVEDAAKGDPPCEDCGKPNDDVGTSPLCRECRGVA